MIDDLLVNIHYNYYCITKRDKYIYIYIMIWKTLHHQASNLSSNTIYNSM
jgi:hypothetical protein